MSTIVQRYVMPSKPTFTLDLPIGSQVLMVGEQGGGPSIWVGGDTSVATAKRTFSTAAIGDEVPTGRNVGSWIGPNGPVFLYDDYGGAAEDEFLEVKDFAAALSVANSFRLRSTSGQTEVSEGGTPYVTLMPEFPIAKYGALAGDPDAGQRNYEAFAEAIADAKAVRGRVVVDQGAYHLSQSVLLYQVDGIEIVARGRGAAYDNTGTTGLVGAMLLADARFTSGDPLLKIRGCDGVSVRGLRFHGGATWNAGSAVFTANGRVGFGVDITADSTSGPTRNVTVEDCTFLRISGPALRYGSATNYECDFVQIRDNIFVQVTSGVIQTGEQSVHNEVRGNYIGSYVDYGTDYQSGSVNQIRNDFQGGGVANTRVAIGCLWAEFVRDYHECTRGDGYLFPTTTGRNKWTGFKAVRVMSNQATMNIINWNQTGVVRTDVCEWSTYASDGSQVAKCLFNGQSGGSPATVIETGVTYLNGARPRLSTNTGYVDDAILGNPFNSLTDLTSTLGDNPSPIGEKRMFLTMLRMMSSAIRLEDIDLDSLKWVQLKSIYNVLTVWNQSQNLFTVGTTGLFSHFGDDKTAAPGACTINGMVGLAAIPAGQTSVTITNSLAGTGTYLILDVGLKQGSSDATLTEVTGSMLASPGRIVITGNAAATGIVSVWFKLTGVIL